MAGMVNFLAAWWHI